MFKETANRRLPTEKDREISAVSEQVYDKHFECLMSITCG